MQRTIQAGLMFLACFGAPRAEGGFRSPESLVRNVCARCGNGAGASFTGLPKDDDTAKNFFHPNLRAAWTPVTNEPYDFLVRSDRWKLGAILTSILSKQFDKTLVAVAFDNQARAVTLNFRLVRRADGSVITASGKPARCFSISSRTERCATRSCDLPLEEQCLPDDANRRREAGARPAVCPASERPRTAEDQVSSSFIGLTISCPMPPHTFHRAAMLWSKRRGVWHRRRGNPTAFLGDI